MKSTYNWNGSYWFTRLLFLKYYVGVKHVDVVEPNKNRRDFAKNFGAKTHMNQKNK